MADARQVARWIVDDIAHDISGRKGLDNEWDAIDDDDIKQDMLTGWLDTAEAYIKKYEPEELREDPLAGHVPRVTPQEAKRMDAWKRLHPPMR